jgi:signal transduction histidine kinase
MRILVADDAKIERMILKELFESEGHAVEATENGETALRLAVVSLPDLIISDILMPVMDGFTLCKSIRSDSRTAHIPFLFYTATYTKPEDEALGIKMGADGFFRKPMEWDDFYAAVVSLVRNIEKSGRVPIRIPGDEEGDLYKLYNERLIKKLEDKAFELEKEVRWRKKIEAKLRESREELRELTEYLQTTIEKERIRIAREIHDDLGQILTAIKLEASWLIDKIPKGNTSIFEKANAVVGLVDQTILSVKKIITDLRPGILDDLGLAAAVEWQAKDYQQRTGVEHTVFIEPEDLHVNAELSSTIFRICQEALTNAARHSGASQVLIKIVQQDGMVNVSIMDNGIGIDESKISGSRAFGLIGMRERAASFNGVFEISKGNAGGTKVIVKIPNHNHPSN